MKVIFLSLDYYNKRKFYDGFENIYSKLHRIFSYYLNAIKQAFS
jgi:hypothetical protein